MNMIKSTFPKWNAISINMPMICGSFKPFIGVASSHSDWSSFLSVGICSTASLRPSIGSAHHQFLRDSV